MDRETIIRMVADVLSNTMQRRKWRNILEVLQEKKNVQIEFYIHKKISQK